MDIKELNAKLEHLKATRIDLVEKVNDANTLIIKNKKDIYNTRQEILKAKKKEQS